MSKCREQKQKVKATSGVIPVTSQAHGQVMLVASRNEWKGHQLPTSILAERHMAIVDLVLRIVEKSNNNRLDRLCTTLELANRRIRWDKGQVSCMAAMGPGGGRRATMGGSIAHCDSRT